MDPCCGLRFGRCRLPNLIGNRNRNPQWVPWAEPRWVWGQSPRKAISGYDGGHAAMPPCIRHCTVAPQLGSEVRQMLISSYDGGTCRPVPPCVHHCVSVCMCMYVCIYAFVGPSCFRCLSVSPTVMTLLTAQGYTELCMSSP